MGVSGKVLDFAEPVLEILRPRFDEIDRNAEICQMKVVGAMQKAHVGEACLTGTTGYGYDDIGREGLENTYANYFHTQCALVRPQITCGTHALALALSANLRPGDELLSASGKPYDTLEEVIGIRPSRGSLSEYGVSYREAALNPDGSFNEENIRRGINEKTKIVEIQRSRGYLTRPTFSVEQIGKAIEIIRSVRKDVIIMVDNCYGEFTEEIEPSDVGADMVVGSLIKNPGGGLAPTGGYIAGTEECVENAAVRLTAPGLGKEVGATLNVLPQMYQGFFDTVQAVTFHNPDAMVAFCQGIQAAAPIDSFVTPYPDDMPGYDSKVVMAAGAFVSGSTMELSADGPIREPYTIYFQGGLTWPHAKYGVLRSVQALADKGLITL